MKQINIWRSIVLAAGLVASLAIAAEAQQLTYQPVSPTFGGTALNYNGLINMATAQNGFTAPEQNDRFADRDPLDDFSASLERNLLNQLSREIFTQQFNEDLLSEEGSRTIGNFQIDISPNLNGLLISITDISTGVSTQVTVPFF